MPLPPLQFSVPIDGVPHDFAAELGSLATESNAKDIHAHVERLANRRNEMLYSSTNGMPHAEAVEDFLEYRKAVVISNLMAYLLIDQSPEKQLFVQQALPAFLKIVDRNRH